jgi:cytochrome c oxidase assembly protein subunit 15
MANLTAMSVAPVAERERRLAFLRRLALLCALLVLAITSLSAFIRLSRAGLSCDEALQPVRLQAVQPGCYGQNLRQLQQGLPATAGEDAGTAAARLAHRVVASTALLLVITMVVVCLTARPLLWHEGRVALALLALALFLAVLGRWSGNARVPAVAIGNLLGGFAMLALCWRLARRGTEPAVPWLRVWAGLGVAMLVLQVAIGGLLSASFAATSCTGFADCIAASAGVPWSALDPWREPVLALAPPINPSGALVQAVHRLAGVAVSLVVLPLGIAVLRNGRRSQGALLLALPAAELALGLRMAGGVSLALVLMHNLLAALLLATVFDLARGSDTARPG